MTWRLIGRSALALTVTAALGSCAPSPENCQLNQTATGALVGAGIGGVLGGIGAAAGHASAGTGLAIAAGGALVGAAIGGMIGHHQDEVCHQLALKQALDQAVAANQAWQQREATRQASSRPASAPSQSRQSTTAARRTPASAPQPEYQTVAWANKATNDTGAITPLSNVTESASSPVCMTYNDQQTADGKTQIVSGKACQGPDGEWKLVN